jgi:predicted membrane protein (TIGR00267 family)
MQIEATQELGEKRARTFGAADLREVILGAQDNLINVLATVLGVAIGAGRADMVALAGLATGVAEAISMGGVLYTSTCAERDLDKQAAGAAEDDDAPPMRLRTKDPMRAAVVTFIAALIAAAIPLSPFAVLPLRPAMLASALVSIGALFVLGGWKGGVTARSWWRDGLQFVAIGSVAALASALIGIGLRASA